MRHLPRSQSRFQARRAPRVCAIFLAFLALGPLHRVAGGAQLDEDSNRPKVTAVRFWSQAGTTRIAIESTGEFRFKSDRLHNPERLFFDLLGVRPQLNGQTARALSVIPVRDRFVRQIRVAETQRGVTRVVFDLESQAEFTTSQLANPDRLIIELRSTLRDPIYPPEITMDRTSAPPAVVERRTYIATRHTPRLANLDFSAQAARREAWLRTMAPTVLDPPYPFDFSMRYATRQFNKPDPLEPFHMLRVSAISPPVRVFRTPTRVVARATPPPPLLESLPPASLPVSTVTSLPPRTAAPGASIMNTPEEIGMPAKRTSQGDTMIRVLGLKLGRVVIDPGHGGHDSGTSGPDGLEEKDIVLDVSKRLGLLIQERLGSEVVYTRTDDTFIPLTRRTALANEKKADLFLSIHVNSSPVRAVSGVETYYLNFTTSKTALDTAMRENAGADRNVGELQDILKKIALKDKVDESREFASHIQTSLTALGPKSARAARDRGIKRAPFVVLIGASMPSVLAEVGFITNFQDATLMRRAEYRQRIAEALYKGLASYANSLSHFQVAQQSSRLSKVTEGAPQ